MHNSHQMAPAEKLNTEWIYIVLTMWAERTLGCHEAEAFTILEAEASTLVNLEAKFEA